MALQSIGYPSAQSSSLTLPGYNLPKSTDSSNSSRNQIQNRTGQSSISAKLAMESYTSEKYALEFTSKDGDKVSFSYEAVKYSKTTMDISASGTPDEMKDLKNYVKNMVRDFLKNAGVNLPENEDREGTGATEQTGGVNDLNGQLPEYWNAENTSQRIVDFATSFFDAFKGAGDEYLSKVKAAIEDGFKQAQKFLGNLTLPDSVNSLIKDTHDKIMEKLDKWAAEKGIISSVPAAEAKQAEDLIAA